MAGSETGMMTNSETPFNMNLQKNQIQSQQQQVLSNMHLSFAAAAAASPLYQSSGGGGDGSANEAIANHGLNINMQNEPLKRKRGRPRKYGPDGGMALALIPGASAAPPTQASGGFSPSPVSVPPARGSGSGSASPTSLKKARGRPPGSGKKQHFDALGRSANVGSAGAGFTPHVITVKAGEDVSSKIMSFSQNGPRAVCILTANGAISNVTLRQPAMSGGTVTYEGRFEILSLSGSYLLSENGGQRSRTGGLSVSLSGPDGRVLGGGVAGLLTAAAPVQVVVGSFIADGCKEKKSANQTEYQAVTAPPKLAPIRAGSTGVSSPPSHGTLSESSGGPGSPFNHNSNPQGMTTIPWK